MAALPARWPAGGDEDPDRRAAEPEGLAEYEAAPWEPVVTRPDPMSVEEQQALLDAVTDNDAPWWLAEGDHDPDGDHRASLIVSWRREAPQAMAGTRPHSALMVTGR